MVSRLTRLLPPPRTAVQPQPWEETRATYGTTMPRDFQDFVGAYGYGTLDNVLSVFAPGKWGQEIPDPAMSASPSVAEGVLRTFQGTVRVSAWPAEEALLSWGTTPVGYDLFWRRRGSDPDLRPVVVVGHRSGTALELPRTMAEFVVRMLGDPSDRPADITGNAGHPHSRYLNTRDEAALDDAGENPWEYLDDFWDAREEPRGSGRTVTNCACRRPWTWRWTPPSPPPCGSAGRPVTYSAWSVYRLPCRAVPETTRRWTSGCPRR
ncbi:hypothetical protein ACWCY6_21485 [Streptomyces sp. 900105755]